MSMTVGEQLAALKTMTVADLRGRWSEVFGEPTRCGNKQYLTKRIAWRIQALAEGGLSERARSRARELANDADLRLRSPARTRLAEPSGPTVVGALEPSRSPRPPVVGALLTREYKGQRVCVRVLPRGFEYEGRVFRSLTAVAREVTGSHWNGNLFFKITGKERAS